MLEWLSAFVRGLARLERKDMKQELYEGQKVGMLTLNKLTDMKRHNHPLWECRCDCGKACMVPANHLRSQNTKSCGCWRIKFNKHRFHYRALSKKHLPTYRSWSAAKGRCNNPANKYYGARGIKMCERWMNSYANFVADMGERPEGLFIDRINNDGNYEPGNCRWATRSEQERNKRHPKRGPYKKKVSRESC